LAGLEKLCDDERYATNGARVQNRETLLPLVRQVVATRPSEEWLRLCRENGIPAGPIRSAAEALADPQIEARGFVVGLEHPHLGTVRSLATPIHFGQTPIEYTAHPPLLGEQTDAMLGELGYAPEAIAGLRARGVA
jgi:crotonobetainyl-CoA:carnitine CoA-transferase CaiB-like acyl-CoA transferase